MATAKTKTVVIRPLLIAARKKAHLSRAQLADKANIDRTYLFLLEHNKRLGDLKVWRKIQEALSLKDNEVWSIINTTKRVNRKDL